LNDYTKGLRAKGFKQYEHNIITFAGVPHQRIVEAARGRAAAEDAPVRTKIFGIDENGEIGI